LQLVVRTAAMLEELEIPYALGGSLAAAFFGEPRSTMDIDVAIEVDRDAGEDLLRRAATEFVVPIESARHAVRTQGSFNLLSAEGGMKIDLFVLGQGLLDRRQIERRVRIAVPGAPDGIWVTSPEDQVLRKLSWYRSGGSVSDRQWRDVLGIMRGQGEALDVDDLHATARQVDLTDLLERALDEVGGAA
jgi:hypothetical protein